MKNYRLEEYNKVIQFVDIVKPENILDVGCGEGRYAIPLAQRGYKVTGVDKNCAQADHLTQYGVAVLSEGEFVNESESYDLVLMSHIIEHVSSSELIEFMDSYLKVLKTNGYLIIATPFLHSGFYDDYDHVHPYTPAAILSLYSDYVQLQAKPRYRLEFRQLWIRRWPYSIPCYFGENSGLSILKRNINRMLKVLFMFSDRLVGRRTGWVGLFQRIS